MPPCSKIPGTGKDPADHRCGVEAVIRLFEEGGGEGLEHPVILLAIWLQFEFAARMSEILKLEWAWVDLDNRRVAWPDSKTGGMSKPMSAEAVRLLAAAPRLEKSPYVCPSIFDPDQPMSKHTYYKGWRRILGRAGLPPIGTHGIRHRSATDIANSGIP
jgi:integrase